MISPCGELAQSVEHFVHIEGVAGSSPVLPTKKDAKALLP